MSHRHLFDSKYGVQFGVCAGEIDLVLMCRCGQFGASGAGEWMVVPNELLPSACTHLSRRRRRLIELRNCCIALAVGALFGWLLWI